MPDFLFFRYSSIALSLGVSLLLPSCESSGHRDHYSSKNIRGKIGSRNNCCDAKAVIEPGLRAEVVNPGEIVSFPVETPPEKVKKSSRIAVKKETSTTETLSHSSLLPIDPVRVPAELSQKNFEEEPAGKVRRNLIVTAREGDQIVVADDDNVTIQGSGGIVMISGRCVKLDLKSNDTEVYCDIANEMEISGNGNSVTLGTLGKAATSGNRNKVTWENGFNGGEPEVTSSGADNELQKRPM